MGKIYKLLIINPGSTSTKVSYFENERNVFTESISHDAPELLRYPTANDQIPMRRAVIEDFLQRNGVDIRDIDVYVGRGGCAYAQGAGIMTIDARLAADTAADTGGTDHPSKLGVMLAYELCSEYGGQMYTLNPINTDEYWDLARPTGIKDVYRRPQSHVLNQKGMAAIHAQKMGRRYEDMNLIVCHIDGGVTVGAHRQGRMVDGTVGSGGDGPFAPTRLGSIPIMEILDYLERGHTTDEMRVMLSRSGGFVSHFGTNDSDKIRARIAAGDRRAALIWDTMLYQLCKSVGEMAVVLEGKVDGILLTGGLARFPDVGVQVRRWCGWIAPVYEYPGECEQETLAREALKVLRGEAIPQTYSGAPVWQGFDF